MPNLMSYNEAIRVNVTSYNPPLNTDSKNSVFTPAFFLHVKFLTAKLSSCSDGCLLCKAHKTTLNINRLCIVWFSFLQDCGSFV